MLEAAKTPVTAPHGKNHGKHEFPLETGNLSHHLKKNCGEGIKEPSVNEDCREIAMHTLCLETNTER